MHSHFNPRQFIQHVNFRTLAAPDTFNQQVDLETDNLYPFMKKCRGVKNVTISPDHHGGIIRKTISWKYLKEVLVSSGDIWKLRSLPEINSLYYSYIYYSQRYYYDYAYYLRNSLVKLCLTGGMVGFDGSMLTSLKDFKVLENLKIVNLIDSIDTEDLNILLTRYLPKYVKKLSIEFVPLDMEEKMEFNTTTEVIRINDINHHMAASSNVFSALEVVNLTSYVPIEDQECY